MQKKKSSYIFNLFTNTEHSCNSMISNNVAIDNNSPDVENTQPKKKKCKSRSKSSCRMRNKKSSKSKKSAKMKGRALSKAPSVFERLTNVTKNNSNQGKLYEYEPIISNQ